MRERLAGREEKQRGGGGGVLVPSDVHVEHSSIECLHNTACWFMAAALGSGWGFRKWVWFPYRMYALLRSGLRWLLLVSDKGKAEVFKKTGSEIGKQAAAKSGGLFSAEDWQCSM